MTSTSVPPIPSTLAVEIARQRLRNAAVAFCFGESAAVAVTATELEQAAIAFGNAMADARAAEEGKR